jgi:hypothetical protein
VSLVLFVLDLVDSGKWPKSGVWPTVTKAWKDQVPQKDWHFADFRNLRSRYKETRTRLERDAQLEYKAAAIRRQTASLPNEPKVKR